MAMLDALEHYLFRDYSIAVKEWLENTVYLKRYPKEGNVTIVYGTPDRAWAEYIYPVLNAGTLSPNINFHLSEMEYLENENINGYVKSYTKFKGKDVAVRPPLIYRLTYSATFFTRTQSELDILFYQILSKAYKNRKAAFMVDGQWAELWATGQTYETNMEPPGTEDIIRRGSLQFVIERAYLPLPAEEFGRIEQINMSYVIQSINKGVI